jgi:hypothetical protein
VRMVDIVFCVFVLLPSHKGFGLIIQRRRQPVRAGGTVDRTDAR